MSCLQQATQLAKLRHNLSVDPRIIAMNAVIDKYLLLAVNAGIDAMAYRIALHLHKLEEKNNARLSSSVSPFSDTH